MLWHKKKFNKKSISLACCSLGAVILTGCQSLALIQSTSAAVQPLKQPQRVVFFLGDGMGITTLTAARIYAVGEDGQLPIDQLPESAFVRTFSEDAQVTDSAPSMGAYMTGV